MKHFKFIGIGFSILLIGLVAYTLSSSPKAFAATCSRSNPVEFNLEAGCGWFHDEYASSGGPLFGGGIQVNSTSALESFINGQCAAADGTAASTSASVIVMAGLGYSSPTTGGCHADLTTWDNDVAAYGSYGCSGSKCTGPSGSVNFNDTVDYECPERDTYLTDIGGTYDVAPYWLTGSTSPACGDPAGGVIIFYDTNGDAIFFIRRDCGNILRDLGHLAPAPPPVIAESCTFSVTNYAIPDPKQGYTINVSFTYNSTYSSGQADKNGTLTIDLTGVSNGNGSHTLGKTVSGSTIKGSYTEPPPGGTGEIGNVTYEISDTKDGPQASKTCTGQVEVANASCGGVTEPPIIDPKEAFKVSATVDYTPPSGLGVSPSYRAFQTNGETNVNGGGSDVFHMTVTGPGGTVTPTSQSLATAVGTATETQNYAAPGQTGQYTVTYWTTGTLAPTADSPSIPGGECTGVKQDVANLPYFNVSGDVETGDGMTVNAPAGGTTCTNDDPKAGVVSWNQENAAYSGAGTQAAALALGYLQDFATGQNNGTYAPSGLSMANTSGGLAGWNYVVSPDLFGGGLGSETCAPDYYGTPTNVINGNDTISSPISVANGTHTYVYVNGNVYLNANITYAGDTPGFSTVQDIPSYTIVANGNIIIGPNVTSLDGLYVAEPTTAGANGVIYTCNTAPFAVAGLTDDLTNFYATCDNKLTVNGSLVANQVWMLRTGGTLYDATNTPAEQFNFNPEIWLTTPTAGGSAGTGGNSTYDSITSLPPSL